MTKNGVLLRSYVWCAVYQGHIRMTTETGGDQLMPFGGISILIPTASLIVELHPDFLL